MKNWFKSVFRIYRSKNNITEVLEAENSVKAFELYHQSKSDGFITRLFNQDGIQIAGIWR